jgi:hypothetical protein
MGNLSESELANLREYGLMLKFCVFHNLSENEANEEIREIEKRRECLEKVLGFSEDGPQDYALTPLVRESRFYGVYFGIFPISCKNKDYLDFLAQEVLPKHLIDRFYVRKICQEPEEDFNPVDLF